MSFRKSKIFIGLVGEKRGGKETFTKLFREILPDKNIASVRFSDVLYETLNLWSIPATRENLQKLAVIMKTNNGFGEGALTKAIYERILRLDADIVIVDGVRWRTDVELIRKFPKNLLVYITADAKLRYKRQLKSSEKANEEHATFAQFMKEEQAENEILIPEIGKSADYKIENNSTLKDLKLKVIEFTKSLNEKLKIFTLQKFYSEESVRIGNELHERVITKLKDHSFL